MSLDPRTPVIVGVGTVMEQGGDPSEAAEPLELMARALENASEDAGERKLLSMVDGIWTPRGFWGYSNPGQLLADRFGASNVRSVVAEIGILQTTVLGRAAEALATGKGEIAMIVGGESRDRDSRRARAGLDPAMTIQTDSQPTETLRPHAEIMSRVEMELGLAMPVTQYSMIDNALRFHEKQSMDAHRRELGALWASFNRVAVSNPDAWNRNPMSAEAIVSPGGSNRMLSYPYTKSLVSQWNVNQAAGMILCTLEKARSLGLDESRFVYPLAVVDSEYMLPLSERSEIHRSPGFKLAGERALSHIDVGIEEVDLLELYSCFPAAVRVQQRELGVDPTRLATQTGGMTFAGGPLNHFALQGWVKMVERLRANSGGTGLVTAVSGLMTKQGVSLLGTDPKRPFLFDNVTEAAAASQSTMTVLPSVEGKARVAGYTVIHGHDGMRKVALACDLDEERRVLVAVDDSDLADEGMQHELCGRAVELGAGGLVRWD
jgi:acetyl-CoA C-acetyltransferase